MIISSILLLLLAIIIIFCVLIAITSPIFLRLPRFGKTPSGRRLERIKQSPHYRKGKFRNTVEKRVTGKVSFKTLMRNLKLSMTKKKYARRPPQPLAMVKRDLKRLNPDENLFVWFGHSAYLLSLHGTTVLVDPTFCTASPVSFLNKPFEGTDRYQPEDMPETIDFLIITHDHFDHLDYETVARLKDRVKKVVCPLGVGEHFEHWGFLPEQLVEMDWDENSPLADEWTVHCLPSHHFSGRFLKRNKTLWASFLLKTPHGNIFLGCDGGYGPHFREIGERHPDIDLAILENGQYNELWASVHTLPDQLGKEAIDLGAKQVITVHHSKYALALHPWDEPLRNEAAARDEYGLNLLVATLGEVMAVSC